MDRTCRVWVIDDDRSIRWVLQKTLEQADMDVTCFDSADRVLKPSGQGNSRMLWFRTYALPGMDGLELLELLHTRYPEMPVIIMTAPFRS